MTKDQLEIKDFIEKKNAAMVQKDIATLSDMMDDDIRLVHADGQKQTKAEWLNEIAEEKQRYFNIKTEDLNIIVSGDSAKASCISVLDVNAYGTAGVYRLETVTYLRKTPRGWVWCNPEKTQNV